MVIFCENRGLGADIKRGTDEDRYHIRENEQKGLRMVSGQNYFYAFVHAIEAVLEENNLFPIDHKSRGEHVRNNPNLFPNFDFHNIHLWPNP